MILCDREVERALSLKLLFIDPPPDPKYQDIGPLPIVLVKGMRICQLIIEEVREVPSAGYAGSFNQQGPEPKKPKT